MFVHALSHRTPLLCSRGGQLPQNTHDSCYVRFVQGIEVLADLFAQCPKLLFLCRTFKRFCALDGLPYPLDGRTVRCGIVCNVGGANILQDSRQFFVDRTAEVFVLYQLPHLHLCFVPLTADGRLSAKEIIGNRKNLVKWQDEFWQHMVKQYPELERGESASQTGREHIPPRIFKEMTQLTKQKEQLDALLVGINPFNGKSRAAEISKVLDSYIPAVSKMRTELNRYQIAFTETAAENKQLKKKNKTLSASLDKATEGSVLKRLEDAKLRQDYEAALKTLDRIPPEVIRFYENRTQESVVRHDK